MHRRRIDHINNSSRYALIWNTCSTSGFGGPKDHGSSGRRIKVGCNTEIGTHTAKIEGLRRIGCFRTAGFLYKIVGGFGEMKTINKKL